MMRMKVVGMVGKKEAGEIEERKRILRFESTQALLNAEFAIPCARRNR